MTAIPTSNPADEDCGEFACFNTFDSLAAYLHHKYGEAALREVFGMLVPDLPKESFDDTATELENRGLDKPAAILRELAESATSEIERVPVYVVNAGPDFVDAWRIRWIQQREIKLGTFGQKLRRIIARNHRQTQANTQNPSSHKRAALGDYRVGIIEGGKGLSLGWLVPRFR
jgi:hypothetical protein